VLYIPVALWAGISLSWSALLVVPAFLILVINAHALGLAARADLHALPRRDPDRHQRDADADVPHARVLAARKPAGRAKYILWNPFAQMLDLLRTPLMGGVADATTGSASWLDRR
jgi:lipopolysaccharide transport system permease protein